MRIMPIEAQLELIVAFSDELGQVISSRFIEKIKAYSDDKFQRGICNSNRLFLEFSGKEELTPFILSLIKRIGEMGKEYKIGVRDYYLPYYEISFDCDHIGNLKIPFTQAVICNGSICKVAFKDVEKDFLRRGSVRRIISLILSKTREKSWKLLHKYEAPIKATVNPYEEIEKAHIAAKGLAKNEYFYLPEGAREISCIKNTVLDSLSRSFRLDEFFPLSHLSFSLLESEDVLDNIPPEIFESVFGEIENSSEAYEAYFISGSIKSISARSKGVIFDEIPFNLYKAMEQQKITKPLHLYAQKNKKIYLSFFDTAENYPNSANAMTERMKKILEEMGLNFRVISRKANGEFIKFEAFLPHNKTWLILAEAMLSDNSYTKIFCIDGKSGQLNINLEYIFLAKIAQGLFKSPCPEKEKLEAEELPREKSSASNNSLLE